MHQPEIFEIVRHDPRYAYEAYAFVFDALHHTQKALGRVPAPGDGEGGAQHHVNGSELLHGACELAREEFGLMAKVVFHQWGIHRTDDIGEIVFNLIEAELLSKTDHDDRNDFRDVFDIGRALTDGFTIALDELAWTKRGAR